VETYITPSTTIGVASCPRVGVELDREGEAKPADVAVVDLLERAVALLGVSPAVG
jgi:hypothetical protein